MISFSGKETLVKGQKRNISYIINKICSDHKYVVEEISYVFVNDEDLLKINQEVLSHDYYTDIITFDYTEGKSLEAEIYISFDRVKENAEKFNVMFHVELLRVIFHGVLHCVGYKDKNKEQKETMRKKEEHYINLFLKRSTWNK